MFRLFIYPFRIISIRNGVRAAFTVGMIFPPEVGKDGLFYYPVLLQISLLLR